MSYVDDLRSGLEFVRKHRAQLQAMITHAQHVGAGGAEQRAREALEHMMSNEAWLSRRLAIAELRANAEPGSVLEAQLADAEQCAFMTGFKAQSISN